MTLEVELAYLPCNTTIPIEELVFKSLKQRVTLMLGPGQNRTRLLEALGFAEKASTYLLTNAGLEFLLSYKPE